MNLSNSLDGSSSCQCTTTSDIVADYARRFAHGHWSFLGPGSEKKWCGTHPYKPNGKWDRVAEDMMLNFSESGHPVFRGPSALARGDLKKQRKGKLSVHLCGDDNTAELVLRTIISVNQLSIYGAAADMCDELACRISGWFRTYRGTRCSEQSRDHGDSNRTVDNEQNASNQ